MLPVTGVVPSGPAGPEARHLSPAGRYTFLTGGQLFERKQKTDLPHREATLNTNTPAPPQAPNRRRFLETPSPPQRPAACPRGSPAENRAQLPRKRPARPGGPPLSPPPGRQPRGRAGQEAPEPYPLTWPGRWALIPPLAFAPWRQSGSGRGKGRAGRRAAPPPCRGEPPGGRRVARGVEAAGREPRPHISCKSEINVRAGVMCVCAFCQGLPRLGVWSPYWRHANGGKLLRFALTGL